MISLIGNKRRSRGYTFLELMAAITILAGGIVGIYKALLASLDHQEQLTSRLFALNLMAHEISMIDQEFKSSGVVAPSHAGKVVEVSLNNRVVPFRFDLRAGTFNELKGLVQAEIDLSWPHQGRTLNLKRSLYFVYPNPQLSQNASEKDN